MASNLITAGDVAASAVSPGPVNLAPGRSPVEGDEGGDVGRPDGFLRHSRAELTGHVDSPQSGDLVEISKVVLVTAGPGVDGVQPGVPPDRSQRPKSEILISTDL